jgi:exodeoxyribonuclease VII small subunit
MPKKKTSRSGPAAAPTPDFEAAMKELEGLVERMEKGELSLEESLKMFERGVELTRTCQKALKDAEQKVQKLISQEGKPELVPFEEED